MHVYGHTITDGQQNACIAAMRGKFKAADIKAAAIAAGVPEFCNIGRFLPANLADRVADRLLQRQRKAGLIKRDGVYWVSNQGNASMDIQKLKAAGFVEVVYQWETEVFWKKLLKASAMPDVCKNLDFAGLEVDDNDEVFVEFAAAHGVQMGIPSIDYYQEPVSVDSNEGLALLCAAGVEI